jgi:glycosyltransferase involved in cell wall biosynthesis
MTRYSNEDRPLVSVVVTTYNRPGKCKRALQSVERQTYDRIEIVVVEDGTDTDVKEWLSESLPSASYIRHDENKGLATARNTGLDKAKSKFVAYLDDDDEWKPQRIDKQIDAFYSIAESDRDEVGVVYCGRERRTPNGDIIDIEHPENEGVLSESIKAQGASTLPSTFLFNREALDSVGGFDDSLPSSIDHDIWMSLAVAGYRAITVDDPLVINYESPSKEAMTTNTIQRIYGVKTYVDKWTPTYQKWFGQEEGELYAERYFAEVITTLSVDQFRRYSFSESIMAICAIWSICNDKMIAFKILFWGFFTRLMIAPLPDRIVNCLDRIFNSFQ